MIEKKLSNATPLDDENVVLRRSDKKEIANVSLSNLTSTGEAHFANPDLSNLSSTGQSKFANPDLSNLSSTGQAVLDNKLDITQIYSSVLQIPNKFTVVNNGAASSGSNTISFTLKAGSILTNANGTTYTVNSDDDFTLVPGQIACFNTSNGNVAGTSIDNCFSGSTAPASATTNAFWLDIANKQVKRKTSSGTWATTFTLPFMFFDYNGKIKLFNSFGFIGSSLFSLPGIKTLHPDGKNADGTLNNFVNETTNVQIITNPYGNAQSGKGRIIINGLGNLGVIFRYVESKEEPATTYTTWFNPATNEMKYAGATAQNWQEVNQCIIGKPYYTYSSGVNTFYDIDIYTPFVAANHYKAAEKNKVLNKTQVTNCILEEPDNTIYEYDDSSFTFKAGSIAIFPYGTSAPAKSIGDDLFNNGQWIITDIQYDSGKLFYWAKKQNDLTLTSWSASAQSGDFMTCYGQDNGIYSSANNYSGTSIPEGVFYGMFYNTNDNRVYRINNGSIEEYQSNYYSLPFIIVHFDNSLVPKSVKQVFKGQGYIGRTRWLDKGVKLLFPNGRNSDGTLNNIEAVSKLLILSNINNSGGYTTIYESYLLFSYNSSSQNIISAGHITADRYFETDNLDEIPQEERNAIVYRPSFNDFWWYNASEDKWYERTYCIMGEMYYNYSSASKILEFKPKNTFRAVDDFDLRSKLSKNALYSTVYINGTSGYREWFSDEALSNRVLLEQWGTLTSSNQTITFLKEMSDTNYNISLGANVDGGLSGNQSGGWREKTTTGFYLQFANVNTMDWRVIGV